MQIGWSMPQSGSVKLNTNGASKRNLGQVGSGGLIKNSLSGWLSGFNRNVGICSSYKAELWEILEGLKLALKIGYKKVVMEANSRLIVKKLSKQCNASWKGSLLLFECNKLLEVEWEVKIFHCL